MNQVNRKNFRRSMILGLISLATTSGCASMKPPTEWFAKSPAASTELAEEPGLGTTLANTGKGITGQFKSMGSAVGSAYTKTKTAVTNTFTSKKSDNTDDPTSLATMPTNLGPEIWVTNGQLYESQGNFTKALDNYTKALELQPNNEAGLLSTARLYSRQSQHEQAVEFYGKAIAVNPDPATYNELALAYKNLNRIAEAQAAVRQAIVLDPASQRYRNNLAGMLVAGGRSDEAVKELLQVFPPAIANYNIAYLHFSNKNLAGAQQYLNQALQIDPNLNEARLLLTKLQNSSSTQTAVAAYQTGESIYRTAQAIASPTVDANTAVYQMQPPSQ